MSKEIGSEFWDVPIIAERNLWFPENTKWFLSGRIALTAIIRENNFKTAALPSWCCDSMIQPFLDAGIHVRFYSVLWSNQNIETFDADVLLLLDYFGFSGYSFVPKGFKGTVIRDLTHSLFSIQYQDADYYFGSLRKWCGIWTGGFAWSVDNRAIADTIGENEAFVSMRKQAMQEKADYIENRTSSKQFLSLFQQAEEQLDSMQYIYSANSRDVKLSKKMDIGLIKTRRRNNALVLTNALRDICVFPELHPEDCPLFVPICVHNRDQIRKKLIQDRIYCPVHWPLTKLHQINSEEEAIYTEEISLICDQRYTEEDMYRIVKSVGEALASC